MTEITRDQFIDLCSEVCQAGYEIADCNEEGLTDFDEAKRIASERNQHVAGYFEFLSEQQELDLENEFNAEFYNDNLAIGSSDFWSRVIQRYGSEKLNRKVHMERTRRMK